MKKFQGYYKNEQYGVGCNGKTVYIYDSANKEIAKFSDFPYAYNAAFMPNKNIIAVKSTEGCLGFYDLDKLLKSRNPTTKPNFPSMKQRRFQKLKRCLRTMKRWFWTALNLIRKQAFAMYSALCETKRGSLTTDLRQFLTAKIKL